MKQVPFGGFKGFVEEAMKLWHVENESVYIESSRELRILKIEG